MVAENRRVPTLSNLSPCSWYLTLFEDKQGSKSGGIDIWCFIHLVYMLLNWFSSPYRVFLVLFESLQVWSCIGWEMNQLEQKRQKTVQFGDFHAEQSWWLFWIAEQPEWLFRGSVPAAEIFKETTTYFGICPNLSIFSPSRLWFWYIFFFCFSWLFYASLQRGNIPKNSIVGFAYCKGRRISTLLRRILNPISFILLIQHVFFICYLCVFLLHGWVVSLLSLGC